MPALLRGSGATSRAAAALRRAGSGLFAPGVTGGRGQHGFEGAEERELCSGPLPGAAGGAQRRESAVKLPPDCSCFFLQGPCRGGARFTSPAKARVDVVQDKASAQSLTSAAIPDMM